MLLAKFFLLQALNRGLLIALSWQHRESCASASAKARCWSSAEQFSSVPLSVQFSGLSEGQEGRFNRDPLQVFSLQNSSVQCLYRLGCQRDMRDGSAEIFFKSFLQDALVSSSGIICPLFNVVHPTFPLPTTASPSLQGVLKDDFGQAVVACDMPEPCLFPSLDSCQKRFLWTREEDAEQLAARKRKKKEKEEKEFCDWLSSVTFCSLFSLLSKTVY